MTRSNTQLFKLFIFFFQEFQIAIWELNRFLRLVLNLLFVIILISSFSFLRNLRKMNRNIKFFRFIQRNFTCSTFIYFNSQVISQLSWTVASVILWGMVNTSNFNRRARCFLTILTIQCSINILESVTHKTTFLFS